ncbi:alpha-galactosidase [Lactiplantibacillus sp. WILCCON 0030]|uniref:Alpha-galactosidase n=1 Tax=Lactiplantibacillus brownii TaxID=3069269 RepID=A0ABU1A5G9_9LACO|nr:alpha-galactosidase [Lactiplantibacillus brownii]MDQ7936188.1 alpha-galactosidase [Lactiplantibacillus brownii]
MPIKVDKKTGLINLYNDQISYVIQILDQRYPVQRYFGATLADATTLPPLPTGNHAFAVDPSSAFPYSVTSLPLEYSTIGSGDYRQPGYLIENNVGQLLPILTYTDMTISDHPINPDQFPQTVAPTTAVTTLTLHLADTVSGLKLALNYTLFDQSALILRSTTLTNSGTQPLTIQTANSLQLDLPDDQYEALTFSGTHAHEANPTLAPLRPGIQCQRSLRGTSGPQQQPFMGLARPQTTEFSGDVLGTALVWSGNFQAAVEVDQYAHTRLTIGLEPTTFQWQLTPGTSFQSPEATLAWSDAGFNGLSQVFHDFGNQIQPSLVPAPITVNTWESSLFNVTATTVSQTIQQADDLGIQLVVVDDGWFVNRHGENGQLGDWQVDSVKFPKGLRPLADLAHQKGLKFGLWLEPEMVTTNSQLYQAHPDWALHYQQRSPITARHQLVLDLSRATVRQHLLATITKLIENNHLDYLKWDMNRHLTQVGNEALPSNQQGELYYRYVLGLYALLAQLRARFPKLIIENCSAGGGRLDFGMLAYTNQTWLSDLTDPVDRAVIENGFSYLFPPTCFSTHVSASPNGQNGRVTDLQTRLNLASIGNLGFEMALNCLTGPERQQVRTQIEQVKLWQPSFTQARFYRLRDWRKTPCQAWLLVTPQREQALLFYTSGLSSAVKVPTPLPLHYLEPQCHYLINAQQFSGQTLNQVGLTLPPATHDFASQLIWLKACD